MRTIYKYDMPDPVVILELPVGYEILTAQYQGDVLRLWIMIDTKEKKKELVTIQAFGTGHPIENVKKYIGTVQKGVYVWHVFEINN